LLTILIISSLEESSRKIHYGFSASRLEALLNISQSRYTSVVSGPSRISFCRPLYQTGTV